MQLTEWMAYAAVEPFGNEEVQAEYRAALVSSTLVNVNMDQKKKPIEATKFMREQYLDPQESDPMEVADKIATIFGKKLPRTETGDGE